MVVLGLGLWVRVDGGCRLVRRYALAEWASRFSRLHRLAGQLFYLLPELVIAQRQPTEGGLVYVFNKLRRQLLTKQGAVCSLTLCGSVAQSMIQGVRCCQPGCLAVGMGAITAPSVLTGRCNHRGANRVHFDITLALQQIFIGIHQAGAVATFPQGAGAVSGGRGRRQVLQHVAQPLPPTISYVL